MANYQFFFKDKLIKNLYFLSLKTYIHGPGYQSGFNFAPLAVNGEFPLPQVQYSTVQ